MSASARPGVTTSGSRPVNGPASGQGSTLPLVLGGLGAVLVCAAGAAGIGWANEHVYSPTAPVERYLEALQAGDGSTARGLSQAALPQGTEAGTLLLDGEQLAATVAPLQDLQVQDAGHRTGAPQAEGGAAGSSDAERRQIEVTGTADGEPFRTVFTVSRTGHDWLFFDRWAMDPVQLPTVAVKPQGITPDSSDSPGSSDTPGTLNTPDSTPDTPANGTSSPAQLAATLNGAPLPLTGTDGTLVAPRLAVFPPAHLEAQFQSSNLASAPVEVTVSRAGQEQVLPLTVTATDQAVRRVQEQVEAYLSECTRQQVLHPTSCPLDHQSTQRVDPSSIRWEMVRVPEFSESQITSAGSATRVTLEGTARIHLTERDLMTGEQRRVQEDVPVTFNGTVVVTPESVRFTPEVE